MRTRCELRLCKSPSVAWPPDAVEQNGRTYCLESILQSLGVECRLMRVDRPLPEHPRGLSASLVDLDDMLRPHRVPPSDEQCWRATALLVPSIAYYSGGRVRRPMGVMFDVGDRMHRSREGCAVACRSVANSPLLYLRSLAHELGHVFNLMHPHEDEPPLYSGDTLMFETRCLSRSRRFPANVRFEFSDANRAWLIEAPEHFVRPGGAPYGSRPNKPTKAAFPPTDRGNNTAASTSIWSSARAVVRREAVRLEIEATDPDQLVGFPLEVNVSLAAEGFLRSALSADLDPAGGKLRVEARTEDGPWSTLPAVVRDCGAEEEPVPADGALRRTVMLPSLFPPDERPYFVRVQYRMCEPAFGMRTMTSNDLIVRARRPQSLAERSACFATDFDLRFAACLRGFPRRFAAARRRLERLSREIDVIAIAPRLALTLAWDWLRSNSPPEQRLVGRRMVSALLEQPIANHLRRECVQLLEDELQNSHREQSASLRSASSRFAS